eukprot:767123-Hanusia_phi.AAC.3
MLPYLSRSCTIVTIEPGGPGPRAHGACPRRRRIRGPSSRLQLRWPRRVSQRLTSSVYGLPGLLPRVTTSLKVARRCD